MSERIHTVAGFTFADTLSEDSFQGWQPHELMTFRVAKETVDLTPLMAVLVQRLQINNPSISVDEAYAIVHDKDERKEWDFISSSYT